MVYVYSEHIVNNFLWREGILRWFHSVPFVIEKSDVVVQERDEPDLIVNFPDTDGLTAKGSG